MSDLTEVAQAIFQGCGANVGPLIALDLTAGEVSTETSADAPEGELGVLPVSCEIDDKEFGTLTLSSPLSELAGLGRRMLGEEEPDKEGELSEDDLDAIGEVLNLMSGAVDQVIRDQVNASVRSRPLPWWRTSDPGENSFSEGEHHIAIAVLDVPGGVGVNLTLRLPLQLLDKGGEAEATKSSGKILLLGLEEEIQNSIQSVLIAARMEVELRALDAGDLSQALKDVDRVFMTADDEAGFERCRELRMANDTWQLPAVLCMKEPTRETVIKAVESGASHVLAVPTDEMTLLRVLNVLDR